VVSISPFNEPTSRWWKLGGHQEGCHFKPAGIDALLREALAEEPETTDGDGDATTDASSARRRSWAASGRILAASEEWSLDQTLATWDSLGTTARRAVGRLNVHTYAGDDQAAVRARADSAGIDVWVSEFGVGDSSGRELAHAVVRDLRGLRPTARVLWQPVSPDSWGLLVSDANGRPVRETAALEVFARFTRAIRPGMHLVACDHRNAVAAVGVDSVAVVVDASATKTAETLRIDLSRFSVPGRVTAEIAVAGKLGKVECRELKTGADGVACVEMPPGAVVSVVAANCIALAAPEQSGGERAQA